MRISESVDNLSEESKKALQSETWQAVRDGTKEKKEIKHFTAELTPGTDNAYGQIWDQVVKAYLRSGYNVIGGSSDVMVEGETYNILKRPQITVFYDAAGDTLFDVTNERLEKEYEWLMGDGTGSKPEEAERKLPDAQTEPEENTEAEQSAGNQEEDAKKPAECIKGKSESGLCGAAAYCNKGLECCDACYDPCNARCGWLDKGKKNVGVSGAEEKLKSELEKAKEKEFAEPIIGYLIDRCKESESLAADVCQKHKSWENCYNYIFEQARKKLSGISGPVRSDVIYEWAEDYYHLDDKALEEKKVKEAADCKKKAVEKKKEPKKKPDATAKRSSGKAVTAPAEKKEDARKTRQEEPKQKPKKNGLEGQMDMFSLMGM